jgi:hypothetical protein
VGQPRHEDMIGTTLRHRMMSMIRTRGWLRFTYVVEDRPASLCDGAGSGGDGIICGGGFSGAQPVRASCVLCGVSMNACVYGLLQRLQDLFVAPDGPASAAAAAAEIVP